ncbi:hypothetical protein NDU88_006491 [Pleurodeles waltl]|uniref:Uncharacterized protein n=1 Tax=Pleurodeles waltl TaxID=8319 RepID=A0AAV7MDF8_PLEWA|nr:hypothetical protein NDU88_006491 [Pleurodeles waltl]
MEPDRCCPRDHLKAKQAWFVLFNAARAVLKCPELAVVPRHYTGDEGDGLTCQNCPQLPHFTVLVRQG